MIDQAVDDTVPRVTPMFWAFRIMVGLGFAMLALFGLAFWCTLKGSFDAQAPGCSSGRCGCCPRPGSPASSAGSSPNTAASPGPSTACCRRTCRVSTLQRRQPVRLARRVHRLLHRAAGRRDVPDGQVRAHGPRQPGHRPLRRASPLTPHDARASRSTHVRLRTLKLIWWLLVGRAADRLRHHGRPRHGRRHAAALRRPQRPGAPRRHQHRRPALGRQPGLVHHRRAAPSSRPGRWSMPPRSPGSTGPCWRCCGRCSSGRSVSTTAARSTTPPGAAPGTGACSSAAPCRR